MARKQPYEAYTFVYDFSADLGSDTIASVDSVTASGPDSALVNQAISNTETSVLVRWGGGTDGASYTTTVRVVTTAGDRFELDGVIDIDQAAPAAAPIIPAYGTDAGFATWLAVQGYTLPSTAPSAAILRARGSAYVDGYEAYWTGQRTDPMQEMGWPRTGAVLNCVTAIPRDAVPPAVVNASYRAAWLEASTPGILAGPTITTGKRIKSQRVEGAVEREFFDDGKADVGAGPSFVDSLIDGWLAPFACDQKNAAFLWTLGS